MVVSKHSAQREAGREHIPQYPKGFMGLRILQLIFSFVCMSLSAFVLSLAARSPPIIANQAPGIMIFFSLMTIFTSIYNIIACNIHPKFYNYWVVLTFEVILFMAWLVAFALMGSTGAILLALWQANGNSYPAETADLIAIFGSVMAGAGAVGAMNWILFFVSLVMNSVLITRHRSAGLHNKRVVGRSQPGGGEVTMQSEQSYQMYSQPSGYSQVEPVHNDGSRHDVYSSRIMSQPQHQHGYYPVSPVIGISRHGSPALMQAQTTSGSHPSSAWGQSTVVPIYEADSQSCKPTAPMELA
ncbi:membrane-associating domain-containing protein [Microdochium nivale]|nr:membrane-associating domain-containing protein [Microdochium nivale]